MGFGGYPLGHPPGPQRFVEFANCERQRGTSSGAFGRGPKDNLVEVLSDIRISIEKEAEGQTILKFESLRCKAFEFDGPELPSTTEDAGRFRAAAPGALVRLYSPGLGLPRLMPTHPCTGDVLPFTCRRRRGAYGIQAKNVPHVWLDAAACFSSAVVKVESRQC